MDIILKSKELLVKEIIIKTKAKLFKDIEVGHSLLLTVEVKPAGQGANGTYATYIKCTNLTTGKWIYKSFNELPRLLNYFKLEEINKNK